MPKSSRANDTPSSLQAVITSETWPRSCSALLSSTSSSRLDGLTPGCAAIRAFRRSKKFGSSNCCPAILTLTGISSPSACQLSICVNAVWMTHSPSSIARGFPSMMGRNCAGGSRPPVGCLPADQRFCSQHLAGAHVDFGLVVEHKFVCVQGVTDSFDVLVVSAHAAVLARIKDVVSDSCLALLPGTSPGRLGAGVVPHPHPRAAERTLPRCWLKHAGSFHPVPPDQPRHSASG